MKVVILAGGFGTRISEESHLKPKPMIEIGEKPILWHIMKEYSAYGINEFIICAGYKQHVIKEWFADYFIHTSDITFDFTKGNEMIIHNKHAEPWKVTVVDTGLNTQTGGRIKRVKDFVGDDTFMVTPTNFPLLGIGFAIPLLWFIVFLLSWGGTFIMLKVPGINSLL